MTAMTPPAAPIPGAGLPAATVYATWRRILREAPLAEAMFDPAIDDRTLGRRFGLDDDGVATVRAYAATPKPTRMFILNYRFRMTGSVQNALETAAPLTMRARKGKGARACGRAGARARGRAGARARAEGAGARSSGGAG